MKIVNSINIKWILRRSTRFGCKKTDDNAIWGNFEERVLAKAFVEEPDILLLDEPTNHLDLKRLVG